MKQLSPAFITASLTALVTFALIALLFFLPLMSKSSTSTTIDVQSPVAKAATTDTVLERKSPAPAPTVTTAALPVIARNPASRIARGSTPEMNLKRLGTIINRLDSKAEHPRAGFWRLSISGASVIVVGDEKHDRLRILVGIQSAKDMTQKQLKKISQSNFDTALDARYAISQDILWSIYVHPLKFVGDKQFISAVGQTVNLAISFGNGYSSGGILFEGGDNQDGLRFQMIEQLIAKGLGS